MNRDSEPESQLPWTGERYLPEVAGEIQLEHVHRYLIARECAGNKDVLDIACGEGFGSAILAGAARHVVGVDIAAEAVAHASVRYRRDNLLFRQGSCSEIPLEADSIDLVVSFETIEHHDEHRAMIVEIKRVLRPGGLLIISSPDKKEYSILPNYRNPFHIRELFKEEFEDLLRMYFSNLEFMSQRIVYGSGILPNTQPFRMLDYDIKNTDYPHMGLARSRYHIAFASDSALPFLTGGLLEEKLDESQIVVNLRSDFSQAAAKVQELTNQLRVESAQASAEIQELKARSGEIEGRLRLQLGDAAARVRQLEPQCAHLNLGLREAKSAVQSMKGSMSWKVTEPLRVVWDAGTAFLNRIKSFAGLSSNFTTPEAPKADPRASFLANLIRSSGFFDDEAYEGNPEARAQGMDSALHYVLVGEKRGFKPSMRFDPSYYEERYPDIAASSENRLGHYLEMGQMEGRRAVSIADSISYPVDFKTDMPTILLLIHVASRTGAPILGWNIARSLGSQVNVVAVLMRGGQLEGSFAEAAAVVKCASEHEFDLSDPTEGLRLARRLTEIYQPLYAIANSVETRALAVGLADQGVPVIALVHEFSGYTKPLGTLQPLYERAAEVVFSANIVRRSSEVDYPYLRLRRVRVLPQGPSEVPRTKKLGSELHDARAKQEIVDRLRPKGAADDLVVVGMGFVDWRKGVDLFIAAATAILAPDKDAPVRFIWIGQGYQSINAIEVSSYLSEQIARSGLGDRFDLMNAVEDVETIYNEADVLFLSSRLDPLPNVSIDAALRGIPVVCFAEASGIAEILASVQETRELVVPHLDAGAAGALIHSLALDAEKLGRLGKAIREVAQKRFNMSAYVATLDELGRKANAAEKQKDTEVETILATGAFDLPLYLGNSAQGIELSAAVRSYVSLSGKIDYECLPVSGVYTRRPLAGFHPRAYALQSTEYKNQAGRDPLAHYLRAGRPKGPWEHPVLRIEEKGTFTSSTSDGFRVVLHGHFHYTDQIGEFLKAVSANAQPCELILTTNSSEKRDELEAALSQVGMKADVRIVPNRGRDIGPFLTLLAELADRCDLLGHLHGKRSTHVDREFSERWRIFLWQHLIGDEMPMIDIIKKAFMEDPRLGLVFPEDPFLVGWEQNFLVAQELALRLGLKAPLPPNINFPVGTMFWARPKALGSLIKLPVAEDEYPLEPLPIDGTILHALERLLPTIVEDAGYHYATTYFPRFTR